MSEFDRKIEDLFSALINSRRLPHAVLIEGGTKEQRDSAARYLSLYAVCESEHRPCMNCSHCKKVLSGGHSDIYTPKLSGKTNIINVESMRAIIKDASIIPNEADTKVFVLYDVDKCLPEISQNIFLKLLEEPPQSTLFILTAENSKALLTTILSRVQVFSLQSKTDTDEQISQLALSVINGILSVSEVELLYATAKLTNKAQFRQVLCVVSEHLRVALNCSVGNKVSDDTANLIAKKLTKSKIIALIELTASALRKAEYNVNMTLLCTWLCTQYRRITWQR